MQRPYHTSNVVGVGLQLTTGQRKTNAVGKKAKEIIAAMIIGLFLLSIGR